MVEKSNLNILDVETLNELPNLIAQAFEKSNKSIFLVGLSGAPATGKSTTSELLVNGLQNLGYKTQLCPMDGFHFDNDTLEKMNLRSIKGAIETFDVDNFAIMINDLFIQGKKPFYFPIYSRELHNPVAKGFLIESDTQIFIIEGNYIFADHGKWIEISSKLDLKIFLTADENVLRERLIERHMAGGKSIEETMDKVENVDLVNAKKIQQYIPMADYVIKTH